MLQPDIQRTRGAFGRCLSGSFAVALPEPVGVCVHLQDVDVVCNAVEQSSGEPLRAEDLGPLVEGQVAGDERSSCVRSAG
jgi:hypothetical protein